MTLNGVSRPGTAQSFFFKKAAIISGTGKATDFKFGLHIHKVHPNKHPLNILEKRERGRIQRLPRIFRYPVLSQEREKLQISNLASTFRGRNKSPLKLLAKRERGCIQGRPKFFGYPLIAQERGKLQISNLASTFRGSIRIKAH